MVERDSGNFICKLSTIYLQYVKREMRKCAICFLFLAMFSHEMLCDVCFLYVSSCIFFSNERVVGSEFTNG